jgi:hypothetical protein
VVQFELDPGTQGMDGVQSALLFRRLADAVEASPAIDAVGIAWLPPFGFMRAGVALAREGVDLETESISASSNMVGADWFSTLGMRLVEGRGFTRAEEFPASRTGEGKMVVTESLALALFGSEPAVGKFVSSRYENGRRHEIIGVVANARIFNPRLEAQPFAYVPIGQSFELTRVTFDVRAHGSIAEAIRVIREAVAVEAPGLPLYNLRTLDSAAALTVSDDRFMAGVSGVFGVLGVILAAIGLYGVAAQSVDRRVRELGIRLALGARSYQAMLAVLGRLAMPALLGTTGGILASLAASRLLRSRLYDLEPHDPATYFLAVVVLLTVCAAATVVPARRALHVDPVTTLREE